MVDGFKWMAWHQVCNNMFLVIRCKAFTYLQSLTNHLVEIRDSLNTDSAVPDFFIPEELYLFSARISLSKTQEGSAPYRYAFESGI